MYEKELQIPKNQKDLESLCCNIAKEEFRDISAQKYGRHGQKQWGIDIIGYDMNNNRAVTGIQCKHKENPNDRNMQATVLRELKKEWEDVKNNPSFEIKHFIFATTIRTDVNIQNRAKELSTENLRVSVWFWDDIEGYIKKFPRLEYIYYNFSSGADIIDKDFIDDIKYDETNYSLYDFYGAKSYAQWPGIIEKNWDIKRIEHDDILECIDKSFENERRDKKITAIIHGVGGCGKSTLMRRLAVECVGRPYRILWVNDPDDFLKLDIKMIDTDSHIKYLIFVEDWYNNFNNVQTANKFLRKTMKMKNVRVVIGDRNIQNKPYLKYLYGDNKFLLDNKDNEYIIREIGKKNSEWNDIINKILKNPDALKPSLYLILFIIARHHSLKEKADPDINDIKNLFVYYVRKDIEKINKHPNYKGLAKALFHFAHFYSEFHINLSLTSFLTLADDYNGNKLISRRMVGCDQNSEGWKLISPYISLKRFSGKKKKAYFEELITFNHDTLAEDGISKLDLDSLGRFDNPIKREVLNKVIDKGSNISSSSLLDGIIYFHSLPLANRNKLNFINRLLSKKNAHHAYLRSLFNDDDLLSNEERLEYIKRIAVIAPANYRLWTLIISWLNKNIKNRKIKLEIIKDLLEKHVQASIVMIAHINNSSQEDKIVIARELTKQDKIDNIDKQVLCRCLDILRNEPEGKDLARELTKQDKIDNIDKQVLCRCLDILRNEPEGKDLARELTKQDKIDNIDKQVLCRCLDILRNEPEGKDLARELTKQDKIDNIDKQVLCRCLDILRNEPEGKDLARELTKQDKIDNIDKQVLCRCLDLLENEPEGEPIALDVLKRRKIVDSNLLFHSLRILGKLPKHKKLVDNVLISIWHNYLADKCTQNYYILREVIKIQFPHTKFWGEFTKRILRDWKHYNRRFVDSAFIAYRESPDELTDCCREIMENWEVELKRKERVHTLYIRLSLAHPALKEIAIETARDMYKKEQEEKGLLGKHLWKTVQDIVKEGKIPHWFSINDE
ncbi:MAG: TGBp1 family protein [Candidatus Eremiobacteraeota bacterium]|nr:TGBp1 family protein [Candidatus Eremiobacteraeota bacterium]